MWGRLKMPDVTKPPPLHLSNNISKETSLALKSVLDILNPVFDALSLDLKRIFDIIDHSAKFLPAQHKSLPAHEAHTPPCIPPYPPHWRILDAKAQESKVDTTAPQWKLVTNKTKTPPPIAPFTISTQNSFSIIDEITISEPVLPCAEINYKDGDLFDVLNQISLVHCVAEDLHMDKGIAKEFKERLGNLTYLKSLGKQCGEVATLPLPSETYIFYLITKKRSSDKPDLNDIKNSLIELKKTCNILGLTHLALPRLASGLDKVPWHKVKSLLNETFAESGITLDVYTLPKKTKPPPSTISTATQITDNAQPPLSLTMGDFPKLVHPPTAKQRTRRPAHKTPAAPSAHAAPPTGPPAPAVSPAAPSALVVPPAVKHSAPVLFPLVDPPPPTTPGPSVSSPVASHPFLTPSPLPFNVLHDNTTPLLDIDPVNVPLPPTPPLFSLPPSTLSASPIVIFKANPVKNVVSRRRTCATADLQNSLDENFLRRSKRKKVF